MMETSFQQYADYEWVMQYLLTHTDPDLDPDNDNMDEIDARENAYYDKFGDKSLTEITPEQLETFPAFPRQTAFDVYALMKPARNVGGDFYDFFMTDKDHIALVMADVSDKGMPAALFMVMSKVAINSRALSGGSPFEILKDVNRKLCENNPGNLFVTVWMAIIDIRTGKGLAVNAGHEHPVLKKAGGSYELIEYEHMNIVKKLQMNDLLTLLNVL